MKPLLHQFEQCCWDLRGVLTALSPDEVCCEGLTPRQCRVLRAVRDEPELGVGELATREALTASGMSRRVDPLVRDGYLIRKRGAARDGRAVRLELTRKGRGALDSVERLTYGTLERVWHSLAPDERPRVVEGLRALIAAARSDSNPGAKAAGVKPVAPDRRVSAVRKRSRG